jgi:cell division protein FtsW (lipid II flippase)
MFLVQIFSFLTLSLVSEDIQYIFFFAFIQIFLFAAITMVSLIYENANKLLLNNMCMLLGIGLCMVSRLSGVTSDNSIFSQAARQYIIAIVSLIICLFIPYMFSKIRFLKKFTWVYGLLGIAMLSAVLVLGSITHGSKISYTIAGITFQPSEFVKIFFIFFLAGALWEDTSLKRVILTTIIAGIQVLILVISKDLGSALIFFVGFVMIVFAATSNYLYLLAGAVGGAVSAYAAYMMFDHVKTRVLGWIDPWSYIDQAEGYQITQSLFAVGSGSWFGMGLLKGNPTAIPYVERDAIFSSICEEFGVIFGVCLILVCISCFVMMMSIALRIHDKFYQMIVFGIGIIYIFQIFLTIGGGIKFIPLTGVTLPFISYGGSSIMTSMIMFFIVQGIYIRLQKQEGVAAEKRYRER